MERLIQLAIRRYLGGPGRAWLFTTIGVYGYRIVRSTLGRKKIVDVGPVGKGKKIVIEHLPVTHAEQLRAEKVARKTEKKAKRAAKRADRRERRASHEPAVATD